MYWIKLMLVMASMLVLLTTLVCASLAAPPAKQSDADLLSEATNGFSQRLYQKIATSKTEAIFSPYSIHSALSMTSLGTRGRTWAEMASTLGVSGIAGGPHDAYHDLIVKLNDATNVDLYTGNGIFTNPNLNVESSFVSEVAQKYFAKADELNFADPAGPEKKVNDYVMNNTHNMIKDVLAKNSLDANTLMVLVNTVFFNGTWATQFKKYMTTQKQFNQLGGAKSQVDMMRDTRFVTYKTDDALKADMVRLPFKGNRFAMYIVLPKAMDGITDLESAMAAENSLNSWFDGFQTQHVHLEIPKFKIESKFMLKDTLKDMGMVAAFDPALSDFSGMTKELNTYISKVIHKAVIDVREEGTTASAATVVTIGRGFAMGPPDQNFVADHPFLFYLRDDDSNQVLFQGKFSG